VLFKNLTSFQFDFLYATPAWWGFAGEGDRLCLERLLAKMRRRATCLPTFQTLHL